MINGFPRKGTRMAWNPSPAVAEARDIATKHGDDMVIILRFNLNTGLLKSASYGKTKALCNSVGRLSDSIVGHIENNLWKNLDV